MDMASTPGDGIALDTARRDRLASSASSSATSARHDCSWTPETGFVFKRPQPMDCRWKPENGIRFNDSAPRSTPHVHGQFRSYSTPCNRATPSTSTSLFKQLGSRHRAMSTVPDVASADPVDHELAGAVSTLMSSSAAKQSQQAGPMADSPFVVSVAAAAAAAPASQESAEKNNDNDELEPMKYNIPQSSLDELRGRLEDGETDVYWTYDLYRDDDDNMPQYHYCRNLADSEKYAKLFLDEPVLGLDLEWKALSLKSGPIKDNVSTIQLASESRIAVFHVALHSGTSPDELIAPTLKKILEDPGVLKTGANIAGDARRLRQYLDVDFASPFELSVLYRVLKYSSTDPSQINRKLVRLAHLVNDILGGLPLSKDDDVRSSDWTKSLSKAQVTYAASDAYAGWQLYHRMQRARLALDPVPALPDFTCPRPHAIAGASADDDGDGPPTRRPKKKPSATVDLPPSAEIDKANAWLAEHIASTERKQETPARAKRALRVYALWHVQGLGIRDTAEKLRVPPLSNHTVAQYVADAVLGDRLPVDETRKDEIAKWLSPGRTYLWRVKAGVNARKAKRAGSQDRATAPSDSASASASGGDSSSGSDFQPDSASESAGESATPSETDK